MAIPPPLAKYKAKRNFAVTPEPAEGGESAAAGLQFVIQKHWASRLHYDFRLELDGVMLSWAVPKGPSYDTADKRMAVHVEDHPISYSAFEATIPPKQYGAGKVMIWDKGIWVPVGDPRKGLEKGDLKFDLYGHKLRGRMGSREDQESGGKAGRVAASQGARLICAPGERLQRGRRDAGQRCRPAAANWRDRAHPVD